MKSHWTREGFLRGWRMIKKHQIVERRNTSEQGLQSTVREDRPRPADDKGGLLGFQ